MNTTPLDIRPDVADFVAAVRARFADLDPGERDDLLEGLEADVSDLVAERGPEALGDPGVYADELRAAAGLPPAAAAGGTGSRLARRIGAGLDSSHARWDALVSDLPGDPWGCVRSLRPVWWVLRAWVAVQLVDLLFGAGSYNLGLSPIPSLLGVGWLVLLVAVIGSVQVGRGRWWPGRSRHSGGRLVLLALNLFAVVTTPIVASSVFTPEKAERWGMHMGYATESTHRATSASGTPVCNLQPYDAAGHPLQGVQLFDERGRPFDVRCPGGYGTATAPWMLGDVARWNVFPQADASVSPRSFPQLVRREVPAVTSQVAESERRAARKKAAREDEDIQQRSQRQQ